MTQTSEAHSQPGPTRSPVFKGITLAVLLVLIAGCATGDVGTKTAIGGLGGAALGGLIAGAAGGGGAAIAAGSTLPGSSCGSHWYRIRRGESS